MVGCIVGWVIEVIFTFITQRTFINHSALVIGPFNVAYGLGASLLTILLYNFKDSGYKKIFVVGFLGGSILEYIMSWGMELVLGFTAWDYSNVPLNINGRICFLYSLFWGVLAILWVKIIYPWLIKIISKINKDIGKKLLLIISVFLIFDLGLTISAVWRAKEKEKGIEARNSYERFLDSTFDRDYLDNMFCGNFR